MSLKLPNYKSRHDSSNLESAGKHDKGQHDFSKRLTFMLNRIVSLANSVGAPFFKSLGISIPEARALICLLEAESLKMSDLSQMISVDVSTTSYMVGRLEKLNLLLRMPDEKDARAVRIQLTAKGRSLGALCRDASVEHERVLIANMRQVDVEHLKKLLEVLYNNASTGFGGN